MTRGGLGLLVALTLAACHSRGAAPDPAAPARDARPGAATGGEGGQGTGGSGAAASASTAANAERVDFLLARRGDGPGPLVVGVPLPRGTGPRELGQVRVQALQGGTPRALPEARVAVLLPPLGKDTPIRALRVELPAAALRAGEAVRVTWQAGAAGAPHAASTTPFAQASLDAPLVVKVVDREVRAAGQGFALVETARPDRVVHPGRLPLAIAELGDGALAGSGLFGTLPTTRSVAGEPRVRGLAFFMDAAIAAATSATFQLDYLPSAAVGKPGDPSSTAVPDLVQDYEAWLYDRCAALLLVAAASDQDAILVEGYRACSFYAAHIDGNGFFDLKVDERGRPYDEKYSHARGLYLYYALTGDEAALGALERIAAMWAADETFARPYRKGTARGPDKLWTERKLAAAIEAATYAYLASGDAAHLAIARELVDTTYAHITAKDAKAIEKIVFHPFPPQDCLVHSAEQHEGEDPREPWCSPWMSALLVDPLLRYQEASGDARVGEIFVRLARYVRDTGAMSFTKDPVGDSFLEPKVCYRAADGESARRVEPVYGAGRRADGSRALSSEWDDFQHCPDVSALVAAALVALGEGAGGGWNAPAPKPFANQGDSLVALYAELAHCAQLTFAEDLRPRRSPKAWASKDLADGAGKPGWVVQQKIGWPVMNVSPMRKLGWWFNSSLEGVALAARVGQGFATLAPGRIQPANCK